MEEKEAQEVKSPLKEEEKLSMDESLGLIKLEENVSLDAFAKKVEESRSEFYKAYSKQRKLSNILMPVVGLLMAGCFVLLMVVRELWAYVVGGSVMGATLVGMFIFYIVTRKKLPDLSRKYLESFAVASNSYVSSINGASNQRLYFKKRYSVADFIPDRVYKDIVDIASRNVVMFDYKEHSVEMGEVALYKQGEKRHQKQLLFVGRHLSFVNDYHFEDRYIIRISGKDNVDAPTDIEDLVVLKEQNKFSIYGKDGAKFEKDLGKDVINNLMSIECGSSLLNVNIVLWAGRTSIYFSYDDAIVSIPLEKEVKKEAYKLLKKNVTDALEILVK